MAEAGLTTTEAETAAQTGTTTDNGAGADQADTGTILGGDAQAGGDGAAQQGDKAEGGDQQSAAAETVIPEAYELTAPDGFTLDAKLVEDVTPIFKEAGLSNEAANKLLPAAVKFAESLKAAGERQMLDHVASERGAWAREAQADPEIGGAKWEETKAMSAKALDALPGERGTQLRGLLNDSGLGNHPAMIAAMAHFGRAIGEDSLIQGDGRSADNTPTAHKLYPDDVRNGG